MLQRRMFTSDQLKKIRVADTSRHISQKQDRITGGEQRS
jgi:hypothetical protein